jgi:7-cyano-7-deazaguanine reductase
MDRSNTFVGQKVLFNGIEDTIVEIKGIPKGQGYAAEYKLFINNDWVSFEDIQHFSTSFAKEREKGNDRYGKDIIEAFNPQEDLVTWDVKIEYSKNDYTLEIRHPEWAALCPVSGYPDTGVISIKYIPLAKTVELKAFKLYINSFRNKHISHEDCANEVFNILADKLNPQYLKVELNPAPRGNVHTVVTVEKDYR